MQAAVPGAGQQERAEEWDVAAQNLLSRGFLFLFFFFFDNCPSSVCSQIHVFSYTWKDTL